MGEFIIGQVWWKGRGKQLVASSVGQVSGLRNSSELQQIGNCLLSIND